jgi:hypothetical protein
LKCYENSKNKLQIIIVFALLELKYIILNRLSTTTFLQPQLILVGKKPIKIEEKTTFTQYKIL